jgi:2-C-methyl-D-erythritol 4-phosphate cytidylyltransferase
VNAPSRIWAVIPAAGAGERFRAVSDQSGKPKQYACIGDKTVLEHSVAALLQLQGLQQVVIALHPSDSQGRHLPSLMDSKVWFVNGGAERSDSVLRALLFLSDHASPDDWVLVHDAARPCISVEDLQKLVSALQDHPVGGILAVRVVDTLKKVERGDIVHTVDRKEIWQAQTPQMFRFGLLMKCLQDANEKRELVTDEASAIERCGYIARVVEGSRRNIKITYFEDLALAAFYLQEGNAQ